MEAGRDVTVSLSIYVDSVLAWTDGLAWTDAWVSDSSAHTTYIYQGSLEGRLLLFCDR